MRRANGTVLHGQSAGFLGSKHSPLIIYQDLILDNVRIGAVMPDLELSVDRLSGRRDLLQHIDQQRCLLDQTAERLSGSSFEPRRGTRRQNPYPAGHDLESRRVCIPSRRDPRVNDPSSTTARKEDSRRRSIGGAYRSKRLRPRCTIPRPVLRSRAG